MAGFGQNPLGLTPFGLGTPDPPSDPPTGNWGSRWINPVTRDFEQDPVTKQFKQMPPLRQRVYLAIAETRGSSTVRPNDGFRLPEKMGDGFEQLVESRVREALRYLTDVEQVMRIDRILVNRVNSQRASIVVQFTDLETNQPDQVEA